jgi:hypothetical protein
MSMTFSSICRLFLVCRPTTITRLIIAVIIDAVNAMVHGRSMSHIAQKSFETILPLLTYHDSTSAISRIDATSRIEASLDDALPNAMLGASGFAVCDNLLPDLFASPASTALNVSIKQFTCSHNTSSATLAKTTTETPASSVIVLLNKKDFKNSQSRKAIANRNFERLGHKSICSSRPGWCFQRHPGNFFTIA